MDSDDGFNPFKWLALALCFGVILLSFVTTWALTIKVNKQVEQDRQRYQRPMRGQ